MVRNHLRRRAFRASAVIPAISLAVSSTRRARGANDKINLGVIGCGGRGTRLLKAITNISDFHVVSLCDLRPEAMAIAANVCEQYKPTPTQYINFREMLQNENLDACIVATEEANHAKCVVPVLEAGLHCFSEKPMDITVERVDQVVRAARAAKGIYQIGFQRHYVPTFQKCMDFIHSGELGEVHFLQGMWQWTGGVGGRYTNMEIAGTWFHAQACHHVDAMMWVMQGQYPLHCSAMAQSTQSRENPPKHCAEDHSMVMYEFPEDIVFSYTHLMNCPEPFTGEKLWVYGEKGGIDLPAGMFYPRPEQGEPKRLHEAVSTWDDGTYEELEAFARHIRNNEIPRADVEVGRRSTLMGIMGGEAMYNWKQAEFEPSLITWEDLGSTT